MIPPALAPLSILLLLLRLNILLRVATLILKEKICLMEMPLLLLLELLQLLLGMCPSLKIIFNLLSLAFLARNLENRRRPRKLKSLRGLSPKSLGYLERKTKSATARSLERSLFPLLFHPPMRAVYLNLRRIPRLWFL